MSEYLNDGQIIDGKKEDYWITYYANGNKRSQGAYRGGKKEGESEDMTHLTEGSFEDTIIVV